MITSLRQAVRLGLSYKECSQLFPRITFNAYRLEVLRTIPRMILQGTALVILLTLFALVLLVIDNKVSYTSPRHYYYMGSPMRLKGSH